MIEMIDLKVRDINFQYKKMFGAENFKIRDDYQFTIAIAKNFPFFKITKAAPRWIIAYIYEFIHDIFSNYEFDKAMENNSIELDQFLTFLEEDIVKQGKSRIYYEIFNSWYYQTLKEEDLEKLITFFKPKTLEKWNEYSDRNKKKGFISFRLE